MKTQKVSLAIGQLVMRDGFACRGEGQREKTLGSRMMKVNPLRELQFTSEEELRRRRMPLPSILDKAFKGEV